MKLPKGKFPYILGLICAAFVIFVMILSPGKSSNSQAEAFAAPLFNHEMPDDARLIQTSASTNDDGSTSATILLQSTWSEQKIYDFYQDTTYAPAAENDVVTLSVLPLDDSSLEAVKQADLYEEEGGNYWFVYLYSSPQS